MECVAYGIDWSTKALSLGVDKDGMPHWRTVEWPAGVGAQRLAGARAQIVPFLGRAVEAFGRPDVVVVETPFGRVAPESMQMYGVVLCATAEVLDCPIVELGPGSWKLRATGFGGHRKPRRGEAREYGVLTWAREQGYLGRDWNEADAIGCARAGALLYSRDLRKSLGPSI